MHVGSASFGSPCCRHASSGPQCGVVTAAGCGCCPAVSLGRGTVADFYRPPGTSKGRPAHHSCVPVGGPPGGVTLLSRDQRPPGPPQAELLAGPSPSTECITCERPASSCARSLCCCADLEDGGGSGPPRGATLVSRDRRQPGTPRADPPHRHRRLGDTCISWEKGGGVLDV